ncbi:MAG: Rrf2 family transcriptional regulator [Pseudomonadota bacterium]|nr:Rrf2 family transcriptional regulator [Pseudomonadota bacterium]
MRLTHLADYAVVLMTAAARRDAGARLSATDLSQETGVPLPTAQKLMQQLSAHGLLVGQRGQGGGYALARPVGEISLADIVEAVEGPIVLTMCADGVNHDCALDAHCKVKPHMSIVGDAIRTSLKAVSLAQLSSPAKAGVQERDSAAGAAPWAPAYAGEQGVAS